MRSPLSSTPRPIVENFYENSFKQLSGVQQRQVGLLVGAAVADAAARPLDGYSPDEVRQLEEAGEGDVAFMEVEQLRGHLPSSTSSTSAAQLRLSTHSLSYFMYFEFLRTLCSARGEFPLSHLQDKWINVAGAIEAHGAFAAEHGSLLHTLCCVLPAPAIYPYASDEALRRYLRPFLDFLTTPPATAVEVEDEGLHRTAQLSTSRAKWSAGPAEAMIHDGALSTLGVALRHLQCNPDAVKNAALMALPGASAVFPADVQCFVPPGIGTAPPAAVLCSAAPSWCPKRPFSSDAEVVAQALCISRATKSYTSGVKQAIRLGGPTCQRAMLVGALLGAKCGARQIPLNWLSATVDFKPVSTMALEIAQWMWNPPHH